MGEKMARALHDFNTELDSTLSAHFRSPREGFVGGIPRRSPQSWCNCDISAGQLVADDVPRGGHLPQCEGVCVQRHVLAAPVSLLPHARGVHQRGAGGGRGVLHHLRQAQVRELGAAGDGGAVGQWGGHLPPGVALVLAVRHTAFSRELGAGHSDRIRGREAIARCVRKERLHRPPADDHPAAVKKGGEYSPRKQCFRTSYGIDRPIAAPP
mmetsp:Transcript_36139/g.60909  ORF Transcript_36139/g.60909 Transcript_36139/m.60909 type:complete len:211 (+) Transcript_36139:595-1227(+)